MTGVISAAFSRTGAIFVALLVLWAGGVIVIVVKFVIVFALVAMFALASFEECAHT